MHIDKIISAAGGVNALADALGISHVAVVRWRGRGQVPAKRCHDVSKITGIALHVLRPDYWDKPGAKK